MRKNFFATILLATVALVGYVTRAEAAHSVDFVKGNLHAPERDNHGRKRQQKIIAPNSNGRIEELLC